MRTKPQYYWPLWRKLLVSVGLIFGFAYVIAVILFIKFGSLFIKSWKGKEIAVIFCEFVGLAYKWDYMWNENPPNYY